MLSISNILLIISAVFTLAAFIYPWLYAFGMNDDFLNIWAYHIYIIQFFSSTFLHWSVLHLFTNAIFIYIFWNQVELILGKKKYIHFFITNSIFIWLWITFFSQWTTVWISWFCMAVLTYYTLHLRARKIEEYKWWITAIMLNVMIWFYPWISLVWHLFWVIFWIIFYYINKEYLKKMMMPIWKLDNEL